MNKQEFLMRLREGLSDFLRMKSKNVLHFTAR